MLILLDVTHWIFLKQSLQRCQWHVESAVRPYHDNVCGLLQKDTHAFEVGVRMQHQLAFTHDLDHVHYRDRVDVLANRMKLTKAAVTFTVNHDTPSPAP